MFVIGIVAHEDRLAASRELSQLVKPGYVGLDDGTRGCTGNHKHVLKILRRQHPTADHYVILEDDAQPITAFRLHLAAALQDAPAPLVSLYLGTGTPTYWQPRIRKAITQEPAWITCGYLISAVAYAVHASIIDPLIADLDASSALPFDEQVSKFTQRLLITVAYTYPSLVDHEDGTPVITQRLDRLPRGEPRKAWKIGTRESYAVPAVSMDP